MTALVVGTLLGVAALLVVLQPLWRGPGAPPVDDVGPADGDDPVVALREIEFDRATGKLADGDYAELKARYTARALARLRGVAPAGYPDAGAAERLVASIAARLTCPEHGPRPEADARYCGECGRYLAGRCERCGSAVRQSGARYCEACGVELAA
jgi:predicted RNA-binding Zn-ribbon protein involved in translation (DUF1610 family)